MYFSSDGACYLTTVGQEPPQYSEIQQEMLANNYETLNGIGPQQLFNHLQNTYLELGTKTSIDTYDQLQNANGEEIGQKDR